MKYYVLVTALILITIINFSQSIYTEKLCVLNVMTLPEDERFYSHTANSYYDLSYVFSQKRLFGLVFNSSYKSGHFALSYENPNLTPYSLSNGELVQLLAMYDLPTPTRLPSYPFYENPAWFYMIFSILLFFVGKTFLASLRKNMRRWKGQITVRKMVPYAGYLRKRF